MLRKTFAVTLIAAAALLTDSSAVYASQDFFDAGQVLMEEMANTEADSVRTSLVFDSADDVVSFVNFFRQEYYNGSQPLTYRYTTNEYRLLVDGDTPLSMVAADHDDNTETISAIASQLTGETDADTVRNVVQYVRDAICYDFEAQEAIRRENAGSGGPVGRRHMTVGYSLKTGTGVCYDYAIITQRILQAAGIEAAVAITPQSAHAYNLIRIGGNDYIYDVTATDNGWGDRMLNVLFTEENLRVLREMTSVDYTVSSLFPNTYFQ